MALEATRNPRRRLTVPHHGLGRMVAISCIVAVADERGRLTAATPAKTRGIRNRQGIPRLSGVSSRAHKGGMRELWGVVGRPLCWGTHAVAGTSRPAIRVRHTTATQPSAICNTSALASRRGLQHSVASPLLGEARHHGDQARALVARGAGLIASTALASAVPAGVAAEGDNLATTPIKHLVVIFNENITFDHYFATYPQAANPQGEPRFIASDDTPSVNGLTGATDQ